MKTALAILAALIVSAILNGVFTLTIPRCKPVGHWHYANCNRIVQHCAVG